MVFPVQLIKPIQLRVKLNGAMEQFLYQNCKESQI
jgi:hypothetical protein